MANDLLRGRQTVASLTNKSGGGVVEGDVVILSSGTASSFTTTASAGQYADWVGVALETIADNATGRVCIFGYVPIVKLNAAANLGDYIKCHNVAKQATPVAASAQGVFGQVLEASATPKAVIWGRPDQGGIDAAGAIAAVEGEATLDLTGDVSIAIAKTLTINGILALMENSLTLDHDLGTDHHWSGVVISGVAGETLGFGQAVYLKSADSRWWLAKADAEATTKPMIGFCVLAAALAADPTNVLLFGFIRDDSRFNVTVGAPQFLSDATAGAVLAAAPSDSGDQVRVIAYGHDDADTIFVNPSQVWLEIA